MLTAAFVVAGYLCGSLPWGYWLVRIFRGEDIRTKGSGNVGATNVWRVYGPRLGLPAALLDVAKGFAPAFAATVVVGHGTGVLAGAAAMLGHWRPIFLALPARREDGRDRRRRVPRRRAARRARRARASGSSSSRLTRYASVASITSRRPRSRSGRGCSATRGR